MQVKIYIHNTQKSPKTRCGTYAYVDTCMFRGKLETRQDSGHMEGTRNQIDLTACVDALQEVVHPSDIEIIGDLQWISCQAKYIESWEKNG